MSANTPETIALEQKASWANVIAHLTRLEEKFSREIEQLHARLERLEAKYPNPENPASASVSRSSPEAEDWWERWKRYGCMFHPDALPDEERELHKEFYDWYFQAREETEKRRQAIRARKLRIAQQQGSLFENQ